jgi:glycosyltransferase involved in cell wall biosynthesis
MLSVVIPTRNSEQALARTLSSLVAAAAEGVVREVIVVDAGSTDGTRIVADAAGCALVEMDAGWCARIAAGVDAARRVPWFLVLAPDVHLEGEWFREAASFVDRVERSGRAGRTVATFRLAYDEFGWKARLAERLQAIAQGLLGAPLREQGLLVASDTLRRAAHAAPPGGDHAALLAALGPLTRHVLRADAVVLPPADGSSAVPGVGGLARIALSALLPVSFAKRG